MSTDARSRPSEVTGPAAVREPRSRCSIEAALEVIRGKWKLLILWHTSHGACRYGELRRLIPGITGRMLARQLRELEADGILVRTAYPEVPPRVEYTLSPRGRSLIPVLQQLAPWTEDQLGGG